MRTCIVTSVTTVTTVTKKVTKKVGFEIKSPLKPYFKLFKLKVLLRNYAKRRPENSLKPQWLSLPTWHLDITCTLLLHPLHCPGPFLRTAAAAGSVLPALHAAAAVAASVCKLPAVPAAPAWKLWQQLGQVLQAAGCVNAAVGANDTCWKALDQVF